MLRIVFSKVGRRHANDYRILVRERKSSPRSSTYVEIVGTYNTKTKALSLKKERIEHWISKGGAQPSGSVHNLLVKTGVLKGPKIAVTSRAKQQVQTPKAQEGAEPKTSSEPERAKSSESGAKAVKTEDAPITQAP